MHFGLGLRLIQHTSVTTGAGTATATATATVVRSGRPSSGILKRIRVRINLINMSVMMRMGKIRIQSMGIITRMKY